MSAHRKTRTVHVRWRHVAAVLPAAVLTASGIALAVTGSADSQLPQVPDQALTQPDRFGSGVQPITSGPVGADPGLAPGLDLPSGVTPGSAQLVQLDQLGIPRPALAAYQRAAQLVDQADPQCHLDWPLVAAIGRVESDHARFGGNTLDGAGVARPGIIGIPLDGSNGTARITDTDNGRWDRDTVYDRAVGPMQFIPGTWRVIGADADGDGQKNPQDINDAATGTGIYLCSGPGDLRNSNDLYRAVLRYNDSAAYARTVIAIADAYRHGVAALPAASLPAAHTGSGSGSGDGTGSGSGSGNVEAAGARPSTTSTASPNGTSGPAGSGSGGSGSGGSGAGGGSSTQPTSGAGVVAAAGSAASSAASNVVSLVTSVVTQVVALPTPYVTTTTPCVLNVLGVKVCAITTVSSTTTTTTRTSTVTHKP